MQDQEIKYKVTADTTEAKAAFSDINRQVDGMKNSSEDATPKVERLAEAVQYAGRVSGETSVSIGEMASIVGGAAAGTAGVVLVMALGAAALAFGVFIAEAMKAKLEIDKFKEALDQTISKLIEFEDPFKKIKFGFGVEDVDKVIDVLDSKIKETQEKVNEILVGKGGVTPSKGLNVGMFILEYLNLYNALSVEDKKRYETQKALLEEFEKQKYVLEAQKIVADELVKLGGERIDSSKKLLEVEKMVKVGQDNDYARGLDLPPGDISKFGMKGVRQPRELNWDRINREARQIVKDQELLIGVMLTGVFTFKDEFMNAWGEIFGEANSLFEKFMQNIASALLEFAAQKVAGAFLNLIIPGLGTAYGALSGGSSGGGSQQIVINLGDEELSSVVVKGIGQAQRLRIL